MGINLNKIRPKTYKHILTEDKIIFSKWKKKQILFCMETQFSNFVRCRILKVVCILVIHRDENEFSWIVRMQCRFNLWTMLIVWKEQILFPPFKLDQKTIKKLNGIKTVSLLLFYLFSFWFVVSVQSE